MSYLIDFNDRDALSLELLEQDTGSDTVLQRKQTTLESFQRAPLPSRKIEHWKYNNAHFLSDTAFNRVSTDNARLVASNIEPSKIELENALEILIIDGLVISEIENLPTENGVQLSWSDSFAEQTAEQSDEKNLLINLNDLMVKRQLVIDIEANKTVSQAIYLRHISTNQETASISANSVKLCLGQSSEFTLVEHFESQSHDATQLSLQKTRLELAANSKLNHYRLNLEEDTATQVSKVETALQADAEYRSFYLGLGSKLCRTDLDVLHQGKNAHCDITGIYLPGNEQTIDYHTNIEHQVPHCTSNEVFRGIIADKASATFNGKIHIFQDAQKSDAYLNNKNLLLTNQAEINTKPELEIYADDVKCAHGATVAQLDAKSVYYLQTRGINPDKARKMLSIAFIQELLNQVKVEPIKRYLDQLLDGYMSRVK